MQSMKAAPRPYVSPVRMAAAAEKRQDVIAAAIRMLRDKGGIACFALDAIARSAGVTRPTVYNQFGSRRGLLEAVLDDIAARGELARLAEAADEADPQRSLDLLVEIMCAFWSSEPAAGRLQDATALDREFARAVRDRNERRRSLIRAIVQRLHPGQPAGPERDMVDLIFALTTYATFGSLIEGRTPAAVRGLLRRACRSAAGLHDARAGEPSD